MSTEPMLVDAVQLQALLASVEGFSATHWTFDRATNTITAYPQFVAGGDTIATLASGYDGDGPLIAAAPDLHRGLSAALDEIKQLRAELSRDPRTNPKRGDTLVIRHGVAVRVLKVRAHAILVVANGLGSTWVPWSWWETAGGSNDAIWSVERASVGKEPDDAFNPLLAVGLSTPPTEPPERTTP